MGFGTTYDNGVIKVLALQRERSTTRIAHELKVDDGALTIELFRMAKEGVIEICGAAGSTPIWRLSRGNLLSRVWSVGRPSQSRTWADAIATRASGQEPLLPQP